jgi:NAD(P)-dependent dehydrogenase (short-subunit alcohol dehydrogenase family)
VAGRELRDLRALVTGASKGIGEAVAGRLRDEGSLGGIPIERPAAPSPIAAPTRFTEP